MKTKLRNQDELVQEVEHGVDYLWLMRCFEEELAKQADALRKKMQTNHKQHQEILQKVLELN